MKEKTYTMVYFCLNCGKKVYKEIPLGQSAPKNPKETCGYCGCEYFSHPFRPDSDKAKEWSKE